MSTSQGNQVNNHFNSLTTLPKENPSKDPEDQLPIATKYLDLDKR